jgi:2-polyprenyl-6-methoxyphenol hydroxylase-like FAD-dependent oxidoreductase
MTIARSVAIIGGGIGGLTVANSLKRLGLSVSLYERSPYFILTAGEKYRLHILVLKIKPKNFFILFIDGRLLMTMMKYYRQPID